MLNKRSINRWWQPGERRDYGAASAGDLVKYRKFDIFMNHTIWSEQHTSFFN